MKELRMMYLKKFQYFPTTFSPFFFLVSFSNIFVFVFPIEIKMRAVYVGGNERKRECREYFFLSFFSTSFNMFFLCFFFCEREIKKEVCMWEW